jgi:hypothetical protein
MNKKALILSLLTAFAVAFSSCNKDPEDAPILGATVVVKVKNILDNPVKGKTVYMFYQEATDQTKPGDAKKNIVTDDDGKAIFNLNFTELNITESQTSLYFAVFNDKGDGTYEVQNTEGITVKRGDSETLELKVIWDW